MLEQSRSELDIFRQEIKRNAQEQRSRAKPLHELVVSEYFTVDRIDLPHKNASAASYTILYVIPDRKNVQVRRLEFRGDSKVKVGDYIRAKIPRYNERKIRTGIFLHESEKIYQDRKFNLEEIAIEIEIIGEGGRVLRSDRSVDYDKYLKS